MRRIGTAVHQYVLARHVAWVGAAQNARTVPNSAVPGHAPLVQGSYGAFAGVDVVFIKRVETRDQDAG